MTDHDQQLARRFADVAEQLSARRDPQVMLQRIADACVQLVAGCDHAGVSLLREGRIETLSHSDGVARLVDEVQQETGEGPCLDAVREDVAVVVVPDLACETRWPRFVAEVVGTRVASILSIMLRLEGRALGSLNLYADEVDAFSDDDRAVASVLAVHAGVAVEGLDRVQHLETALASRDLIGQAKGILMAREQVDAETAFAMLSRASQHTHRKLRAVAADVVAEQRREEGRGGDPGDHADGPDEEGDDPRDGDGPA